MLQLVPHLLFWLLIGFQSTGLAETEDRSVPAATDTLVVCPLEFQPAMTRWLDYRQGQGHVVHLIPPATTALETRQQILAVSENIQRQGGKLRFLFLIGGVDIRIPVAANEDFPPIDPAAPAKLLPNVSASVPIHYLPAQVNHLFGSEPTIASDSPYGDFNGDGLPDVALGRFPCSSVAEVEVYLDRVIAYETKNGVDQAWRRRINLVAGVGGFGDLIDSLLEKVTRKILTDLIPPDYQTSMTLGSWRSPYCPDPRQFDRQTIEKINEGCLFWVYLGHGHPTQLDRVRLPDRSLPILDQQLARQVDCRLGHPIALFLACYTAAIDHVETCLTEVLLNQPNGPIATIAGTRVTMPYAMSLFSLELIDGYFNHSIDTLGELTQYAKRQMMANQTLMLDQPEEPDENSGVDFVRFLIQGVGKLVSPRPDLLAEECMEHVQMMHLFGDPLLRLDRPEKMELEVQGELKPGSTVTVSGTAVWGGHLCIELVYRRDRFRHRPKFRRTYKGDDQEFREYQREYQKAQDLICGYCVRHVEAGPFELQLTIPDDVIGDCVIRCYQEGADGIQFGIGSIPVLIQR